MLTISRMEPTTKRRRTEQAAESQIQHWESFESPFNVFPEELWLLVIAQVQEKYTLHNLLTAIPEFHDLFYPKLKNFQFNQESPYVFAYQPSADYPKIPFVVNFDWCDLVFKFLKHYHVGHAATLKKRKSSAMKMVAPLMFQYYTSVELKNPQILSTSNEVRSVHENLKLKTSQETLLPHLTLAQYYANTEITADLLKACTALFSEFGKGMQVVSMEFNYLDSIAIQTLMLVSYMPNIHTLNLNFLCDDLDFLNETTNFLSPFQLENLELSSKRNCQASLLQYFINCGYFASGKLKTLKLVEIRPYLECATEYNLSNAKFDGASVQDFHKFLRAHQRKSLYLKPKSFIITRMFSIVEQNEFAEQLVIDRGTVYRASEPLPVLRHVKYLKFSDSLLRVFQFLSAFPALEHLHVLSSRGEKDWILNESVKLQQPLTWQLGNYLYRDVVPKEINIWKVCPSLKSIVVEMIGVFAKHFVRENKNKPVIFKTT